MPKRRYSEEQIGFALRQPNDVVTQGRRDYPTRTSRRLARTIGDPTVRKWLDSNFGECNHASTPRSLRVEQDISSCYSLKICGDADGGRFKVYVPLRDAKQVALTRPC